MSKAKKSRTKKSSRKTRKAKTVKDATPPKRYSDETRAADALTVFWLLTGVASAAAQIVMFAIRAYRSSFEDAEKWLALHTIVAAIAIVAGTLGMLLIPFVIRFRRVPPPQPILACFAVVSLLPYAWIFLFGP